MRIANDRIVEATENELYEHWLSRYWNGYYPFHEFLEKMKEAGCVIIEEGEKEEQSK